jgi:hypothetical protein
MVNLMEAHCWLQGQALAGTPDAGAWARKAVPDAQQTSDFNSAERQGVLTQYGTALLHGLRARAKRSTNMFKTAAVIQKPEETPTDFYERLCEAFQVYIPFDLEVPENQRMASTAFVAQSYVNIHWKLQKLEGFTGMNATQLLEVANKVLVNQDHKEKQEDNKRMKVKVSLLAAALGKLDPTKQSAPPRKGRCNGRTPL